MMTFMVLSLKMFFFSCHFRVFSKLDECEATNWEDIEVDKYWIDFWDKKKKSK